MGSEHLTVNHYAARHTIAVGRQRGGKIIIQQTAASKQSAPSAKRLR
jgi:hypothetical protein